MDILRAGESPPMDGHSFGNLYNMIDTGYQQFKSPAPKDSQDSSKPLEGILDESSPSSLITDTNTKDDSGGLFLDPEALNIMNADNEAIMAHGSFPDDFNDSLMVEFDVPSQQGHLAEFNGDSMMGFDSPSQQGDAPDFNGISMMGLDVSPQQEHSAGFWTQMAMDAPSQQGLSPHHLMGYDVPSQQGHSAGFWTDMEMDIPPQQEDPATPDSTQDHFSPATGYNCSNNPGPRLRHYTFHPTQVYKEPIATDRNVSPQQGPLAVSESAQMVSSPSAMDSNASPQQEQLATTPEIDSSSSTESNVSPQQDYLSKPKSRKRKTSATAVGLKVTQKQRRLAPQQNPTERVDPFQNNGVDFASLQAQVGATQWPTQAAPLFTGEQVPQHMRHFAGTPTSEVNDAPQQFGQPAGQNFNFNPTASSNLDAPQQMGDPAGQDFNFNPSVSNTMKASQQYGQPIGQNLMVNPYAANNPCLKSGQPAAQMMSTYSSFAPNSSIVPQHFGHSTGHTFGSNSSAASTFSFPQQYPTFQAPNQSPYCPAALAWRPPPRNPHHILDPLERQLVAHIVATHPRYEREKHDRDFMGLWWYSNTKFRETKMLPPKERAAIEKDLAEDRERKERDLAAAVVVV